MTHKSDDYYNQKIDNELKKKELEEKHGAFFSNNGNLTPEFEGQWLENIEAFEKQYDKAEPITVFDYIGKPQYKKYNELDDEVTSEKLDGLLELMNEKGVSLSTLCEVDDKELYRFITEELFEYEMDNMRMPGMMSCFIYEEFHPNAKYDVEQALDYFFRMTMGKMENIGGKGYDLLYVDTENLKDANGISIEKERAEKSINNFLDSFDSFEIIKNEIKDIKLSDDETDARVDLSIEYRGFFEKSKETIEFKGDACFKFQPSEYGGWSAYFIDLPGLVI